MYLFQNILSPFLYITSMPHNLDISFHIHVQLLNKTIPQLS